MAWTDFERSDPKWVILTIFVTLFVCWLAQEILERKCGMEPIIKAVDEISEMDENNEHQLNRRMTKSFDIYGQFRITPRAAIQYILTVWRVIMLLTVIIWVIILPDWWYDHFIIMNHSTTHFFIYQHMAASMTAIYSWEVIANRYGKLSWSTLLHHWLTVMAGIHALFGVYSPFSTWFCLFGILLPFPNGFALAFRTTCGSKHPKFTRKLFKFSTAWYTLSCFINYSGQVYLLITGFYTHHVPTEVEVMYTLAMVGWIYDDWQLFKALRVFSTLSYENAAVLDQDADLVMKNLKSPRVKYIFLFFFFVNEYQFH